MTTRRTFLKSLIGGAAALVLGAEAAQAEAELAVPSTKTIIDLNPHSYLHRPSDAYLGSLRRFDYYSDPFYPMHRDAVIFEDMLQSTLEDLRFYDPRDMLEDLPVPASANKPVQWNLEDMPRPVRWTEREMEQLHIVEIHTIGHKLLQPGDLQRFQFAKGKDDYHKGELLYYRYAGEPRSRFRMSAATRRKLRRRS
jgi:hypothetical protein